MAVSGDDLRDICVVTHPLAAAGENATRSLLDVLAAVTGVALVTADLPSDSEIRDRREVVELTRKGVGDSIPVAAWRFVLNQLRMARVVQRRPESVVLFFGATSYVLPMLVARLAGKTVVVEPRGDVPLTLRLNWERRVPSPVARILAEFVGLLEGLGFRTAHAVITYTPAMARQIGLDPAASNVYPTGARYVQTDEFRVKTPVDERDDVVGFLGRLDEEKGIRDLAEVARRLPDGVAFRFVGDGDLRSWLESKLADEIATGAVSITGWMSHDVVPRELNDMKLLVLPSQPTEGLPTTILEALACGTPVLASSVSGVPDVIKEDETGFLIRSREPADLADCIESILGREDLPEISRRGRELVEREYSFEAACTRYREILQSLDGRNGTERKNNTSQDREGIQ